MSYDLAIWEGRTPANDEAALAVYIEIMDRLESAGAEPASDRIKAFVASLLARWPDITTPAGDDSPWADGPLINNASGTCIYFSMVWSRADEASAFAASVAADHGLACFDPQAGILRPGSGSAQEEVTGSRRRWFARRKDSSA